MLIKTSSCNACQITQVLTQCTTLVIQNEVGYQLSTRVPIYKPVKFKVNLNLSSDVLTSELKEVLRIKRGHLLNITNQYNKFEDNVTTQTRASIGVPKHSSDWDPLVYCYGSDKLFCLNGQCAIRLLAHIINKDRLLVMLNELV